MVSAQAAGDIATILRLMAKASELTPEDFIKKTIGSLLFIYYAFVSKFNCRPKDLMDMVDGLLFIEANNFVEKQQFEKSRIATEKH